MFMASDVHFLHPADEVHENKSDIDDFGNFSDLVVRANVSVISFTARQNCEILVGLGT
jgi:hypothetical protein